MSVTATYWSTMETMGREELESLQMKRLRALLEYLENQSLFYRKKFRAARLRARDIRSADDIAKLPFTSKQDIVAAGQAPGRIGGGLLCVEPEEILRWHRTSGTTGKPIKIPDTMADWDSYAEVSAEALYAMGLRKACAAGRAGRDRSRGD